MYEFRVKVDKDSKWGEWKKEDDVATPVQNLIEAAIEPVTVRLSWPDGTKIEHRLAQDGS